MAASCPTLLSIAVINTTTKSDLESEGLMIGGWRGGSDVKGTHCSYPDAGSVSGAHKVAQPVIPAPVEEAASSDL